MTLGAKLQSAYSKVYGKLGTQQGPLVFAAQARTQPVELGRPYTATTTTSTTIATGASVRWVLKRRVSSSGTLQAGDLTLKVPCQLLPEAQLQGSKLTYQGKVYTIVDYGPTEIYGGIPVQWDILARLGV